MTFMSFMRYLVIALFLLPSTVQAATSSPAELSKHALTHDGDPEKGKLLFNDAKRAKCVTCHKVGKEGGVTGPELTRIAGKFDRPHLIESLLEPSRQIVEGYQTSTLLMEDGRVLNGVIREESAQAVTLHDIEGKSKVIAIDQITERRNNKLSLMPNDLVTGLSADEFTDLIAYLETLQPGGKPTPGANIRGRVKLPDGFAIETVATSLSGCTALETLPDGRVLVCEQPGQLRVIQNNQLLDQPMLDLTVEHHWERGLIGVTVHPNFPTTPYVYVCYVVDKPFTHHRISRFDVRGNVAEPSSEKILLKGDDQSKLGGFQPAGHQGGGMHFGTDGHLYVAIGEQTAKLPAQSMETLQGKMLRLTDQGSIPDDNPFLDQTEGKYQAIWATGCRNPFTFAIHPRTGQMLINDVGGKFEEINPGVAGGNYGWPLSDHGHTDKPEYVSPIHIYPQASISGGDFVLDSYGWPEPFSGKYLFADYVHGWIKAIDPETAKAESRKQAVTLAQGLRRPVDLRFSTRGDLYVLLRNAWVTDDKFQGETGSLVRIYPDVR